MKRNAKTTTQPTSGKRARFIRTVLGSLTVVVIAWPMTAARAQGMPAKARENIHTLFNNHDKVTRKLEITDTGYIATTTTDDPVLAKVLQTHVQQMETRLKAGYFIRRWDPAFAEYVEHYDDLDFEVEGIDKGVKVVAVGRTEAAAKVAWNHARVINQFVENGWKAHDASHPTVLAKGDWDPAGTSAERGRRHGAGKSGPTCDADGGPSHDQDTGCGGCASQQESGGHGCQRK